MERRGIGHVEVVIAFVLFIGFLMFGLYFFNPLDTNRLLDSTLFYAKKAVVDNSSTSVITYTIVLNQSVPAIVALPVERGHSEGNGFRVEDGLGNKINSAYDSGEIKFDRAGGYLFYVRFGEFDSTSSAISGAVRLSLGNNFSISSSDSQTTVSESRLINLNNSYYSDYNGLITRFNLPRRTDFAIIVDLNSTSNLFSMTREIPAGLDVSTQSERLKVLRLDGSIGFADLTVKVW